MNRMTRAIAGVLAALLPIAAMPVVAAEEELTPIRRTVDIYFYDSTDVGTMEVVFFGEEEDIPYVSASATAQLLELLAEESGDDGYDITTSAFTTYTELMERELLEPGEEMDDTAPVYLIERENGSFVIMDAVNDLICISDMDLFQANSFAVSGGDLVSTSGQSSESSDAVYLYRRASNRQYARMGDITPILLSDYDIYIMELDGMLYLPVATVSDLLLSTRMTFNGEAMFLTVSDLDTITENDDGLTLQELYYRPGERTRSRELAYFNYCELCLMLDQCYGLKEAHGITDGFGSYFLATGLYEKLVSTDMTVYTEAMFQLLNGYLGDLHSGLDTASPYSGGKIEIEGGNRSISVIESDLRDERFQSVREAAGITVDRQIVDGYTEIGDTAFITFDSFVGARTDYYDQSLWPEFGDIYMSDTISLVVWAQNRIHREDSPIRRVVIDLSCNSGGSLNACVYVAAWVLGAATINIENTSTGAQYSTTYWVDTNLDGQCLDDDDLGVDELEVYCLISGNSFSCGNLLPSIFKQDGRVTLVGQASGGGACVVRNTSAADGTLFRISDFRRLCLVKNGSFYDIDQGVEPDIPLRKPASYYDREALMEYLSRFR